MSSKRGDRVAPPPGPDEWEVRYGRKEALAGWEELCRQAATNTAKALATATHQGCQLPQWQIEVTGAGRIWYVVDVAKRAVWITLATTGHPKQTE